jgi:glycosyltransferase involved in cell wall biosynthesis
VKIVLVVHHELSQNAGAAGSTYRVGEQYRELGHQASIYSYSDLPGWLSVRLRQLLFPVFVALFLARTVRRERPDVVDATTADSWIWALVDPARRRVLLATTCHGLEHLAAEANRESRRHGILQLSWKYPLYYGGLHLREVTATLRRADVALFVSTGDRAFAVEHLGVTPERARVVANGISTIHVTAPRDPTPGDPHAALGIAQVCSWLVQKGVTYSVQALTRVLVKYPFVHASFFGTGVANEIVLTEFDAEIRNRVTVVPQYAYDQLPALLRGHQIILFPSLYEGFGMGLLEAMACGLAPVATRSGGPQEFIRDGANGILVPPRDVGALVDAMTRLIVDRGLLERLRVAARETAGGYTWRAAAEQRLAAYEEAGRRRSAGRSV